MERLGLSEKKEMMGGFAAKADVKGKSKTVRKTTKGSIASEPFFHRYSLIMLTVVPGVLTLGEEILSLIFKSKEGSSISSGGAYSYRRNNYSSYGGYTNPRRDYFAFASESFKPVIKFSPYPSKTGLSLGLP